MTKFENEIESKGYIVYTNVGDSMMPLLRQNKDLMVIRKIYIAGTESRTCLQSADFTLR